MSESTDWVRRALKVYSYRCQRDWKVDLGGPCRVDSSNVVAICQRLSEKPARYTTLTERQRHYLHLMTRDYPSKANRWKTVDLAPLVLRCCPEYWSDLESEEDWRTFYGAGSVILAFNDGREVCVERGLFWMALQHLQGKRVSIDCGGSRDPVHFTAPGWRLVVMPRMLVGKERESLRVWRQSEQWPGEEPA